MHFSYSCYFGKAEMWGEQHQQAVLISCIVATQHAKIYS